MSNSITFPSFIGSLFPGIGENLPRINQLATFYSNLSTATTNSSYIPAKQYLFETTFSFSPADSIVNNRLSNMFRSFYSSDIKYFVRRADLPNFSVQKYKNSLNSDLADNEWGFINSPGMGLPDTNQFTIAFLSTEKSLHEWIFYYWMREAASTFWTYETQPYTTATVIFNFLDSEKSTPYLQYIYTGVYPIMIKMMDPNQDSPGTFEREVRFEFSSFYARYTGFFANTVLGGLASDLF